MVVTAARRRTAANPVRGGLVGSALAAAAADADAKVVGRRNADVGAGVEVRVHVHALICARTLIYTHTHARTLVHTCACAHQQTALVLEQALSSSVVLLSCLSFRDHLILIL